MFIRYACKPALFTVLITAASGSLGQELDDFLDCAAYTDRVERVFCLEKALDSAIPDSDAVPGRGEVNEVANTGGGAEVSPVATPASPETTEARGNDIGIGRNEQAEKASGFRLPIIGGLFSRSEDKRVTQVNPDEEVAEGKGVDDFGRRASVVTQENGEEVLLDAIADLDLFKPNLLQITLESGQVWRQLHAKRFNLRKGDPVRIYSTGWGDNYRLETSRLSGFIQIGRVQ